MPTNSTKLSPGEFETLKILWKLGSGTVAEVRDAHKGGSGPIPAYTTTMTVLGRLVEKEAARVDKEKQPFRYKPMHLRETTLKRRLREFVSICYEGDSELLLRHVLDDGLLEVQVLREVLEDSE